MKLLITKYHYIFTVLALCFVVKNSFAQTSKKYVTNISSEESFPLASKGQIASILVSTSDFPGVLRVAGHLQNDIFNVTSSKPTLFKDQVDNSELVIIIGTLGESSIINKLVNEGKIDATKLENKWEKFTTQIVKNPIEGVISALVIAGSDKRGTIFGIYDLSYQIGVSPLYFWADVPVKKQQELHVLPGIHTLGEPKVKYRGIFINDEAPSLTSWVYPKFGGFNAQFYNHVFELILRMKGNYLWPSMWSRMFYVNDPQNPILANEYGIVMGTSHHEPLTRAHAEWQQFGEGDWNYNTNAEGLHKFWKEGMERRGDGETIVTVGMRGDGDEAMSEGTATELLETIVKNQRKIIADVTGKPASETPQLWALYKEVQDYYDKGMKVPDDVTLLLCDDNWGNIRKLPALDAKPRSGGYGIYYHFDYVGGPRNYKWINTTQIERVWEQMHLAYEHNVNNIWIVNVGDIKPMEFPIEFFLDYAWDPDKWNADNLQDYYTEWSEKQFGAENASAIANLIKTYTKYNARRKHELLNIPAYSLTHFNEADNMLADFKALKKKALKVKENLPKEYHDAYYHLVEHPIVASANLNELYIAAEKNKLYAEQEKTIANEYAQKVKELYVKDSLITKYYHEELADGKWNGIMSQTHIGYTSWQSPQFNNIPKTVEVKLGGNTETNNTVEESNASNNSTVNDIPNDAKGFIENNGYISIEANNFSSKTEPQPFQWKVVENLGKTGSSIISLPIKKGRVELNKNSPKLSYNVNFKNKGKVKVHMYFSPTINYSIREGMYYGLSFDNESPTQVNYDSDPNVFNYNGKVPSNWESNVADNIKIITSEFQIIKAGNHILNYYRVDEGLVLQKIVIETSIGELKKTYLGPPESFNKKN